MAKNLVIVESPAKAKTIEGFLGKDFLVKSSYGHVRDLKKSELSIDVEKGFKPEYEVSPDKKQVVSELKKLSKNAERVWLATDEDREGEAISWHLLETLGLKSNSDKVRRIVFHEITKPAISRAIENPRSVDENLVDAQQARRILDRLVGFELSPILWKKVKPSLSAGRVQSVTVRLIVEREREIKAFTPEESYRVTAEFHLEDGNSFKAELGKRFDTREEAQKFLEQCAKSNFSVARLEKKPAKRTPAAPFTTSTLQQEASRKLSFSVARTMSIAQQLYEEGKITYMRTDSVNLSDTARNAARAEINSNYGDKYSQPRNYSTKSKGAQEAHEAIRPVNMGVKEIKGDSGKKRLYDLIWKRTLASQMADAQLEKTTVHIEGSEIDLEFVARGEVIKFDGFLKVYIEGTDDEQPSEAKGVLPNMKQGDGLRYESIHATQRFTHHPPRYTEASLVKKLEELGIGRPSTYAPTISTIQKRGYVVKEDRDGQERKYTQLSLQNSKVEEETKSEITGAERNKLFPTDIGMVVNDFLVENFNRILDYNFTATVEKQFDEIAEGQLQWNKMIESFYAPFHDNVEDTLKHSERAKGQRELGKDPKTGKPVYARIGRYGPMVQIGEADDEEKPQFASLRKDQSISDISLEEALELFKLPRKLGTYEGKEVQANIGRYGPYVRLGSNFYSIGPDDDPTTITLERAKEVIEEKREEERKRIIKTFDEDEEIRVLRGRYGPYIKAGKKNVRIPKDKTPEELTYDEVKKLVEAAPEKGRGRGKGSKKTASKTAKGKTAKKSTARGKSTAKGKKKSTSSKSTKKK